MGANGIARLFVQRWPTFGGREDGTGSARRGAKVATGAGAGETAGAAVTGGGIAAATASGALAATPGGVAGTTGGGVGAAPAGEVAAGSGGEVFTTGSGVVGEAAGVAAGKGNSALAGGGAAAAVGGAAGVAVSAGVVRGWRETAGSEDGAGIISERLATVRGLGSTVATVGSGWDSAALAGGSRRESANIRSGSAIGRGPSKGVDVVTDGAAAGSVWRGPSGVEVVGADPGTCIALASAPFGVGGIAGGRTCSERIRKPNHTTARQANATRAPL